MNDFVKKGQVSVICDGQYGSTGKGLLAAFLTADQDVDIATTNASANAGHWTKYRDGRGFCCRHLPTAGIVNPNSQIYLNAGSIINPEVLQMEVDTLLDGDWSRVTIHPNASIIRDKDVNEENWVGSKMGTISSTKQGVGAALSAKVRRVGMTAKDYYKEVRENGPSIAELDINWHLRMGDSVTVEIPQGFSLSLNSQFYPYVTSRQCTVQQGLADAKIGLKWPRQVAMSVRTYPIRVGGTSGPIYDDQKEIQFSDLGVEEERTTVTNKVRRIFTWSDEQYRDALQENEPDIVFLNFCNYTGDEGIEISDRMDKVEDGLGMYLVRQLYGYGPCVEDVLDDFKSQYMKDSSNA